MSIVCSQFFSAGASAMGNGVSIAIHAIVGLVGFISLHPVFEN